MLYIFKKIGFWTLDLDFELLGIMGIVLNKGEFNGLLFIFELWMYEILNNFPFIVIQFWYSNSKP
jgi:hypothetical protein